MCLGDLRFMPFVRVGRRVYHQDRGAGVYDELSRDPTRVGILWSTNVSQGNVWWRPQDFPGRSTDAIGLTTSGDSTDDRGRILYADVGDLVQDAWEYRAGGTHTLYYVELVVPLEVLHQIRRMGLE